MNILKKYGNYELHPAKKIYGYEQQAWAGTKEIQRELLQRIASVRQKNRKTVISFDLYPGVDKDEILTLCGGLMPDYIFDTENYAKTQEELNQEFGDFITDDRVFGVICHKKLEDFFDKEKLNAARRQIEEIEHGLVIVCGVGADLLSDQSLFIYCNITRWEIQLRYRLGMGNWHISNETAPNLEKNKRGFFIEWRLADRYKKARYDKFDFMLETETKGSPKLITGEAFRAGLKQISREPFRLEPYFDPGVWGGHWMQTNFDLDKEAANYAWSFDGVPEENCLNLDFGTTIVKVPAMDLVLYCPRELLGERVHGRFGAEFPIRFDLLDTMGGGNLSLQVHPLTEYIQDTFGMHYTQDESYYLLDADESEETYVYLGVKNGIDPESMEQDLKAAEKGEIQFPAEKYVNKVPVKKHDHVLIPAGTVHCSGKNTMVLEISATPYIFTFKLWDWGRIGLDGLPRPIHIEHGMKNIQWDRNTDWIYKNIVGQQKTVIQEDGIKVERTGLHEREFIDTYRYTLKKPYTVEMDDSVHVMNLVEGSRASIESPDDSFPAFEIHYAETAIVPAKAGKFRIVPLDEEVKVIAANIRR